MLGVVFLLLKDDDDSSSSFDEGDDDDVVGARSTKKRKTEKEAHTLLQGNHQTDWEDRNVSRAQDAPVLDARGPSLANRMSGSCH